MTLRGVAAACLQVGPELVLQQGDMLEFTGVVESFGRICEDFGLEPVTAENELDDDLVRLQLACLLGPLLMRTTSWSP